MERYTLFNKSGVRRFIFCFHDSFTSPTTFARQSVFLHFEDFRLYFHEILILHKQSVFLKDLLFCKVLSLVKNFEFLRTL